MSWRAGVLAIFLTAAACGGSSQANEPKNAKEKQLAEAKKNGELDDGDKKWGKWRYRGDRGDCFYSLNGKCFKTEVAACKAAACKAGKKCKSVGGGPATVSCK